MEISINIENVNIWFYHLKLRIHLGCLPTYVMAGEG